MRRGKVCLGVFFVIGAMIYIIIAVMEEAVRVPMVVLAALFLLFAFLLFRKKKEKVEVIAADIVEVVEPVDAYIEADGIVYRTDGQPISDREVPYLIEAGFQEALRREQNNPYRRNDAEQELIFRFTETHGSKSAALASKFETLAAAAYKTNDLDEKVSLLTAAMQHFHVAREWHYKISKGGMMWFQDMWENGHRWADIEAQHLADALRERDYIRPFILEKATEGFIQKDIYTELPNAGKSDVQRVLKQMEYEGLIVRIKKGSSYFVGLPQIEKAGED